MNNSDSSDISQQGLNTDTNANANDNSISENKDNTNPGIEQTNFMEANTDGTANADANLYYQNEIENELNNMNTTSDSTINDAYTQKDDSQVDIALLNSSTIEKKFSNVVCTVSKNSSEEDLRKQCYNYGICQLKKDAKENEPNNGRCIFNKIFCNAKRCYLDDGCANTYVKHTEPQFLRECEKNPTMIFEACQSTEDKKKCRTRPCSSNEQCLSGNCVNEQCLTTTNNPIRYCSNNDKDEFQQSTDVFQCHLFLYERCEVDSDCLTGKCAEINGDSEHTYCVETKITFVNAMACMLAYSVIVITLLVLHSIYRHTKKTKSH